MSTCTKRDLSSTGIYIITNHENDKVYIGSTAQGFRKRWEAHRSTLRRHCHSNPHLQRAWNKYGVSSFEFGVLEYLDNPRELHLAEQFWLNLYREDGVTLYNFGSSAQSPWLGRQHSAETREKLRKANTGKRHTEKTKKKISKVHKGKQLTDEHKAKISKALFEAGHGANPYPAFVHRETGKIIPAGVNLAKMCREHELERHGMNRLMRGHIYNSQGWMLLGAEPKIFTSAEKAYPALIHCETGKIIPAGVNLAKMCRRNGLEYYGIHNMVKSQTRSSQGWVLLNESNTHTNNQSMKP